MSYNSTVWEMVGFLIVIAGGFVSAIAENDRTKRGVTC